MFWLAGKYMPIKGLSSQTLIHLLLIVIAGCVVYSNTFDVPFQFDDEVFIVNNPLIRDFSNFTHPSSARSADLPANVRYTSRSRTVSYATFWLNYKMAGLNVTGYHAVNLLIHLLNALLVYTLVSVTFRTPVLLSSGLAGRSRHIAFFSALIFAVHPLHTEAVTYIAQRFTSLVALFYLAAVVSYAQWRRLSLRDDAAGTYRLLARPAIWYILSFLSALLAMKTKENAATLPLALLLYEAVFFSGPFRKRLYPLLPFAAAMLLVPLALFDPGKTVAAAVDLATRTQKTSRLDYLFTQFGVMLEYLRLLFLPVRQNLDYDWPIQKSFFALPVLFPLLILTALALFGVLLLKRASVHEKGLRLIAFGIFWFFVAVSVESSIVPLYHVIYEHRAYLPSVGMIIAAVSTVSLVSDRIGKLPGSVMAVCLLTVAAAVLAFAAHSRNGVWHDEVSLWEDVAAKSPGRARAQLNLGLAYANRGRLDEAIDRLQRVVRLEPDNAGAYLSLAAAAIQKGTIDTAIRNLAIVLRLKPGHAGAYNNLGIAYEMKGQLDDAVTAYQAAIRLKPDLPIAHYGLGSVYRKKGLEAEASEHFQKAQDLYLRQELR